MRCLLTFLIFIGSAFSIMAHPAHFHGDLGSAAEAGFLHPFTGLDHLLVMVAVGLWAVQIGGRALWLLPCSFVGAMLLGGILGLSGYHLTVIDSGILASIVLLGAALGMAWRPPVWSAALFVGAAGLCHGYAHGSEISAGLIPAVFFVGMVSATSLLHAMGVAGGLVFQRNRFLLATRIAGVILLSFALYAFFCPVP